ncbi:MAG: DUF3859 domain-containing protein [Hyphomicrobiales bacterium]|nr:DUF3859 domain-containing protein [Hyphomicrobiales bacterium]
MSKAFLRTMRSQAWAVVAILAAMASIADPPAALAANVDRIQVVEYGIYTAVAIGKVAAADTASGTFTTLGDVRHATTTTRVPLQLGERFGYRYRIFGAPAGAAVRLKYVTIFPAPGLVKPGAAPKRADSYVTSHAIGRVVYVGYTLDHPWELVPGVWTFQIWSGNRKLAERKFTLVGK